MKKLKLETEPMVRAAKKAYNNSETGKLDALYAERSRWLRKETIARNKLVQVERDIERHIYALAGRIDGVKPKEEKKP